MAAGRPPSRHSPTTACSRLQWIFVVRLLPDAILLQPPVERAAAHAELLCREADIAIVARQDLFDAHALRFLQRQIRGARRLPARFLQRPDRWRSPPPRRCAGGGGDGARRWPALPHPP